MLDGKYELRKLQSIAKLLGNIIIIIIILLLLLSLLLLLKLLQPCAVLRCFCKRLWNFTALTVLHMCWPDCFSMFLCLFTYPSLLLCATPLLAEVISWVRYCTYFTFLCDLSYYCS